VKIYVNYSKNIHKYTDMQASHFFSTKFGNVWHITRLSVTNCREVINSQKQSSFYGPPCRWYI